jgi:hypothetical protein
MYMNKKISYFIFLSASILCLQKSLLAQNANSIYGKWKGKDDKEMNIEFYNEADKTVYGKAISNSKNGKIKMSNIIFRKLVYNAKCNCLKGTMHPSDANINADAKITFISNTEIKISISKFLMSKTLYLIKTT